MMSWLLDFYITFVFVPILLRRIRKQLTKVVSTPLTRYWPYASKSLGQLLICTDTQLWQKQAFYLLIAGCIITKLERNIFIILQIFRVYHCLTGFLLNIKFLKASAFSIYCMLVTPIYTIISTLQCVQY